VLLLAGMKGIPGELLEAAAIDGAGPRKAFLFVTLPMITPIIFFNLVTGLIGALQTFAQVYIVTSGGPDNASQMIVPYLFENAFKFYKMGYASAIAWVLFLMILLLTLLVFRSSALWVYYEEGRKHG
jgi:multiple sugar transport system permease protein